MKYAKTPAIWCMFCATALPSLVASTAQANANISISIGGNQGASSKLIADDPVAVGGIATADPNNTFLQLGSPGAASADLAAGTVRVLSSGVSITKAQGAFPFVNAQIADKITISGPGPTALVKVRMAVEAATLLLAGTDIYGNQGIIATLDVGTTQHKGIYDRSLSYGDAAFPDEIYKLYGFPTDTVDCIQISGQSAQNHNGPKFTVVNDVEIPVNKPTIIAASLNAQGAFVREKWASTIDAQNTARLEITLPDGYTMTSESGVLLTKAGSPGLAVPQDGGVPVVHGSPGVTPPAGSDGGGTSTSSSSSSSGNSVLPDGGGGGPAPESDDDGGCHAAAGNDGGLGAFGLVSIAALVLLARKRMKRMKLKKKKKG